MFPSPFGVICSLINKYIKIKQKRKKVSVSFRSYMFSNKHLNQLIYLLKIKFPSPFGVICSLIDNMLHEKSNKKEKVSVSFRSYMFSNGMSTPAILAKFFSFPSPFGVICSLMVLAFIFINILSKVSVSFRSYMFSNPHMRKGLFYKKFFGYFRVNFLNFYFFQFSNKKTC